MRTLAQDTPSIVFALYPRLHEAFMTRSWSSVEEMVDWIYETLFLMPSDDPFLGLSAPDAFSALPS
jgi:hypothetical protein